MLRPSECFSALFLMATTACVAPGRNDFRTVEDYRPLLDFANTEWDPEPHGHPNLWHGVLLDFGPRLSLALRHSGDSLDFTWREYAADQDVSTGMFDMHSEAHVFPAEFLNAQAMGQDCVLTLGRTGTGETVLHQWTFRPRVGGWFARTQRGAD
jgi:hypothetical protein